MKAKALLCLCCIVAAVGCTKDDTIMLLTMQEQNQSTRLDRHPFDFYKFSDSAIVLGAKLNNPYSVANLQIARDSLIAEGATPSSLPAINVTHYYARFKPADDDALAELIDRDTTIIYYEFPLDYEIKEHGISYHDPAIADTLPTYQYASVPILKWQNLQNIPNVECTLLEPLCILDEDKGGGTGLDGVEPRDSLPKLEPDPRDTLPFKPIITPGDDMLNLIGENLSDDNDDSGCAESAISALMSKSFELTGNGDYEEPSMTRASSKWRPAGRIRAYDNIKENYIPLEGVKVRARRWFTTHSGITNKNGYYTCNGKFSNPANYSIVWETPKYNIRDGNVVQAYYNGSKKKGDWNLDINDGKSVRYATIHRAAYRIFFGNIYDLFRPKINRKINLAYHHKKGNHINGDYNRLWGLGLWSDIRIYGKDKDGWRELSEIFSTTCHELGHAAHHTNSSYNYKKSTTQHLESWARFVQHYLTQLEYTELGLYDIYSPYIGDTTYRTPDNNHNWQNWNNAIDKSYTNHYTYTPLYIDLYDDYNQQEYYRYINSPIYDKYPDDDIHITASILQNFVFKSRSFEDMKLNLHNYVRSYTNYAQSKFNLTEENINKLFSYYE